MLKSRRADMRAIFSRYDEDPEGRIRYDKHSGDTGSYNHPIASSSTIVRGEVCQMIAEYRSLRS